MKRIQTRGTVFVNGTTGFAFAAMYRREKKNWIVLRAKHQREGFIICMGLLFSCSYHAAHTDFVKPNSPRPTKNCCKAHRLPTTGLEFII